VEIYVVSFVAGLIFAKDIRMGAVAGVFVGILAVLASGAMDVEGLLALASMPELLPSVGPRAVLALCIFALTGAAGGLIRGKLFR
jgi:hypothetical protein